MRKLFLIIPVAAVLLAALATWKLTRPPAPPVEVPNLHSVRPAPLFSLHDQHGQLVRLTRHIGRDKLLIVFFQANRSFDESPALTRLQAGFEQIQQTKATILAIGTNQSGIYRRWMEDDGPLPFRVLSDVLDGREHRKWGAVDPKSGRPQEAVFIVDRLGWVRHAHSSPDLGTAEDWTRELRAVR